MDAVMNDITVVEIPSLYMYCTCTFIICTKCSFAVRGGIAVALFVLVASALLLSTPLDKWWILWPRKPLGPASIDFVGSFLVFLPSNNLVWSFYGQIWCVRYCTSFSENIKLLTQAVQTILS